MRYVSWVNHHSLRARILTVVGLPVLACGKPSADVGDLDGPVLEIPPVTTIAPSSVPSADPLDAELFTHRAGHPFDCGKDRTLAMRCGRSMHSKEPLRHPYETCQATSELLSADVLLYEMHRPFPKFDKILTDSYRTQPGEAKACCYSRCVDIDARAAASVERPMGFRSAHACIAAMPQGSRHASETRPDCPAAVNFASAPASDYVAPFDHEQSTATTKRSRERTGFEQLSVCCYQDIRRTVRPIRGRPPRDAAGNCIVAASVPGADASGSAGEWSHHVAPSEVERRLIARRWQEDAELEHASVAAFAQLSVGLMACGAPVALVAACHQSALDELRHADICYRRASLYFGYPVSAGSLPQLPRPQCDPVALAVETFRDGCVGETAAALMASRSARCCADAETAQLLDGIAEDEARHAELAWRIVKWALRFDGVRDALRREAERLDTAAPAPSVRGDRVLERHGILSRRTEVEIHSEVIRLVILPCVSTMLAAA